MISANTNIQEPGLVLSLVSLDQNITTVSQISIVLSMTQDQLAQAFDFGILAKGAITPMTYDPDLNTPRVPGLGKERILKVTPDFDEPLRW